MPKEQEDLAEKKVRSIVTPIVLAFLTITLVFFVTLLGFAWVIGNVREISHETRDLSKENTNRIVDIQESRTSSCKQTYEGIRQVFIPFYPPEPRTKQQQEDIDKFNDTIDGFVMGCTEQTKPDGGLDGESG